MSGFRLLRHGRLAGPAAFASVSVAGLTPAPRASCAPLSTGASAMVDLKQSTVPNKVIVYQYKICPFCNRVKSYLDFLRIPYETVEVNPLTKGELSFSKDYRKVPIAVFDATQVNDSSPILEHISAEIVSKAAADKHGLFPEDTQKWSEWSEKRLAVMLYPNITRSLEESWECFGYTSDVLDWNPIARVGTRVAGAAAMSLANGKIKKKYNIVDERKELQGVLEEWITAVSDKQFLHGDSITMPDLNVYGVLRSIEGLSTWNEIMGRNPQLRAWYDRVAKHVPSCEIVKR